MRSGCEMLRKRKSSPEESQKIPVSVENDDDSDDKSANLFLDRKYQNRQSKWKRILFWISIFAAPLLVFYVSIPFVFRYSSRFRRNIVFMNNVNIQPFHDLNEPEKDYGLNCTKSFFIEEDELKLGAWHIFPMKRLGECVLPHARLSHDDFNDDRPVFLYFHGNGGTRGGSHRTGLYKVLAYSMLDAHVIAFDYRGYADSSPVNPTADGLTSDAMAVYSWLSSKVNTSRLNVWGHSLGSAISIRLLTKLSKNSSPNSLILDAPFTSVAEAAGRYPLAIMYKWWPGFDWFFIDPIRNNPETNLNSLALIGDIYSPIIILHAKDDKIVPFELGQKLYNEALASTKAIQKAKMITFNEHLDYGHKNIFRDKELPKIIADFIRLK